MSEHRLAHREEAEAFYRILRQRNLCARVGMESSGHSRWFERLLQELGLNRAGLLTPFEQPIVVAGLAKSADSERPGRTPAVRLT